MPTLQEWTDCRTIGGRPLRLNKCNAYRELAGLPPLPSPTAPSSAVRQAVPQKAAPQKVCKKPPGTGDEMKSLLASLGLSSKWCIGCQGKAAQMNRWGIAGCKEQRETIRQWMLDGMKSADWWTTTKAAVNAVRLGLMVDPLDPAGWLVDEAIRRAEAKQAPECSSTASAAETDLHN